MKSICFVSLKSYDLVARAKRPRYVGGAERQQVYLARLLQRRGHRVSIITLDHGQEDGIMHDGVCVHTAYDVEGGIRYYRYVSHWNGLWNAMRRAGADVYHQMGGDDETGQVALWCRMHGRTFVFATAADANCITSLPRLPTLRQRWLYRYGVRRAHQVVTQTVTQRKLMKENFGVESTVIRSCIPDPGYEPLSPRRRLKHNDRTITWVGRFAPVRCLERFFDLAEMCSSHRFVVVGSGNESDPYVRSLLARGRQIPNMYLAGRVSDGDLDRIYRRTLLLVVTSSMDGVPTVFLEAWSRGIPVLSFVDPDNVIVAHGLGRAVTCVTEMRDAISEYLQFPETWDACSRAARKHYEAYHAEQTVADAYTRLLC